MTGILSAITDFTSFIWTVLKLVFNLFVTLFSLLFKGMEALIRIATAYPILTAGLIVIIIVCVVYKILGREASS